MRSGALRGELRCRPQVRRYERPGSGLGFLGPNGERRARDPSSLDGGRSSSSSSTTVAGSGRSLAEVHIDHDCGDVVEAPVGERPLEQARGRVLGQVVVPEDRRDLLLGALVGQAVAAQEQAHSRLRFEDPRIDLELEIDAEGTGEDVPVGVDRGLALGELALADELLDEAVVDREA